MLDVNTEIIQECILHEGKINWQRLPDKYLEEFVREHCDDSSWRDKINSNISMISNQLRLVQLTRANFFNIQQ